MRKYFVLQQDFQTHHTERSARIWNEAHPDDPQVVAGENALLIPAGTVVEALHLRYNSHPTNKQKAQLNRLREAELGWWGIPRVHPDRRLARQAFTARLAVFLPLPE